MVILIGGETHTGKTLLAQRLLERVHYSCTSLDHLKMGLIRGFAGCGFTAEDSDERISAAMWGMVKGIIDTCLENRQNIILEGCYLPIEEVGKLTGRDVMALYLVFSPDYIRAHSADIYRYEHVIEQRLTHGALDVDACIAAHQKLKTDCQRNHMAFFEISEDYLRETDAVLAWILTQVGRR